MKIQRMFALLVTLQVLVLGSLWTGHQIPTARALELPDPGISREKQLDELRKLNDKMDRLIEILSSGKLQVKVQSAEQK